MRFQNWCWEGEGDRETGFLSREAAASDAAAALYLDDEQRETLLREGWLPLGRVSSVSIFNKND